MIKQKIKGEVYTLRKITNNLHRYIELATEQDIEEGLNWYPEANEFCRVLANKHGLTMQQVAGITAALSPQVEWGQNKRWAEQFIASRGKGFMGNRDRTIKCKTILKLTDPEAIYSTLSTSDKGGNKTKAFYRNILEPNKDDVVTIDRHAIAACFFRPELCRPLSDKDSKLTYSQYNFLSDCFVSKAREVGMLATSFQAVLWITVRRIRGLMEPKGIVGFVPADIESF